MLNEYWPCRHERAGYLFFTAIFSCCLCLIVDLRAADTDATKLETEKIEPKKPEPGIIRFNEYESIAGKLAGFQTGETLLWACSDFIEPLKIKLADIKQLTNRAENFIASRPTSDTVRVELVDGDVVYGKLVQSQNNELSIESTSLGRIEIPPAKWLQYLTLKSSRLAESTPSERNLDELIGSGQVPSGWERIQDGYSTTLRAVTIRKNFDLGPRFRVDLRIAWIGKPSFDIAMGIDPNEPSASTAVHLEVWDGLLVLAKQEDGKADTAIVTPLDAVDSMIELVILHDSTSGVTVAQDLNGKELARITLPSTRSRRCSGIQVMNHGEGLRVESLRSSRWPEDNKSEIVRNESITKSISDQVSNQANSPDPSVKLEMNDGCRLTGIFKASNTSDSSISFIANSTPQPIPILIENIHRISQNQRLRRSETSENRPYRMSTNLVTLDVELKPFRRSNDLQILAVDSVFFENPAIVSVGASGNIRDVLHYKKLAEVKSKLLSKSIQARSAGAAGNQSIDFRIPSAIVLRTGETLHAELMSIDESGIHFSSKLTDSSLLKLDEVRSMFLHPRMHPLPIDRDKMQRLMTVPRNQADNAPESLLITTAGDYLRGTVSRLDDTTLDFLVKDKTLRIPRRSISGIVWPHEASTDQASKDMDKPEPSQRPLDETSNQVSVEFIADNSVDPGLLTMTIDVVESSSVENNVVRGRNLLLGDVELPIKKITDISFGDISKKTKDQPSNPWVFTIAKAPTTWEQDGAGDNSLGTLGDSSPLVGVQAPTFRLNDLAGDAIRLDQFRGKVVVLDFWASWCGPCMDSLPEVYRIANSFGDDRCQWLGINLQESQQQAAKIASRLGVENTILLDSDGRVASLYDASAIPLVVVIAPDGIVNRVFIGMEPVRIESLRSAIEACLKE